MKNLVFLAFVSLLMGTGCVMTPTGDVYQAPVDVEAEVGVGGGEFGPRVHLGSRSSVTVWLHPNYFVYDAYPVAQRHCARWGYYARPRRDWSIGAGQARYLDYSCVRRRPVLAYPHFRRSYKGSRRRNRRVITPKPAPRVRRRGTFGRVFNPAPGRSTRVERGKPWGHNRNKGAVVLPSRGQRVGVERGKPWEHNRSKNRLKRSGYSSVQKRSTIKTSKPKISKKTRVVKKTVRRRTGQDVKLKKRSARRGTLSL